jgi:4-diphosphocytidyl-2-C-methyl-D-erythritol kinase
MPTDALRIPAYAKINLSLEVLGKRDDGYHEVATVMQTVDLADGLTVSPCEQLEVECDAPELSGKQNIVWDAAVALATYAGVIPKARIGIEKHIPASAGLGGGSADAAAALRGLNHLWGSGLSTGELASVAASLGSDVPFLLYGGTALGTGRGDELEHLPAGENAILLLVAPVESVPRKTPTLYGALTADDFSTGARTRAMADSMAQAAGTLTSNSSHNVFTRAALEIFPGLADVWERTAAITKYPPCISGAGPAFFCMPSDDPERHAVAEALRETRATVHLVRTINRVQDV